MPPTIPPIAPPDSPFELCVLDGAGEDAVAGVEPVIAGKCEVVVVVGYSI